MEPGDYLYRRDDRGAYELARVLHIDADGDAVPVALFEPLSALPAQDSLGSLRL